MLRFFDGGCLTDNEFPLRIVDGYLLTEKLRYDCLTDNFQRIISATSTHFRRRISERIFDGGFHHDVHGGCFDEFLLGFLTNFSTDFSGLSKHCKL